MKLKMSVLAFVLYGVAPWACASPVKDPTTQPSLEHLAVWAVDVTRTATFLQETLGWRLHPMVFGVPEDNPVFGGMDLRFVDANGLWLELVQPTADGPGMAFLNEKGNGALVELDFFVQDFDRNVSQMKARGIEVIGMDGKPMVGDGLLQEYVMVGGRRAPRLPSLRSRARDQHRDGLGVPERRGLCSGCTVEFEVGYATRYAAFGPCRSAGARFGGLCQGLFRCFAPA